MAEEPLVLISDKLSSDIGPLQTNDVWADAMTFFEPLQLLLV
jgi:hypothetical protein